MKWGEARLLDEIIARFPGQEKRGAALLGVTPMTYRRHVETHTSRPIEPGSSERGQPEETSGAPAQDEETQEAVPFAT